MKLNFVRHRQFQKKWRERFIKINWKKKLSISLCKNSWGGKKTMNFTVVNGCHKVQTRQAFIRNYVPDKNFWIKRLQLHLDMNESVQKGDKKLSRDNLSVRVHNQFGTHCIANIYSIQSMAPLAWVIFQFNFGKVQ